MMDITSFRCSYGRALALLLAVALLSFSTFACGEEGIGGASDARFQAMPSPVSFSLVPIGEYAERTVVISNTGQGELQLRDIELVDNTGNAFSKVGDWPVHTTVGEGESIPLTVRYEPQDDANHSGAITMGTNDPTLEGDAVVQITTLGVGGEIFVNPPAVNFPQTPPDGRDIEFVEVLNIGAAPLTIDDIFISSGSDVFSVDFPDERTADSGDNDDSHPSTLEYDDEPILLRVAFAPQDWDPKSGTITILSSDSNNPELEIEIRGNSGDTCLEVSDEEGVDFGPASMGNTTYHTMTLRNCSPDAELELTDIEIFNDGGGVFSIQQESLPEGLPGSHILQPGEITTALIGFHPTEEIEYNGSMVIKSDASRDPELMIPLTGTGVDADCPVAVATGSIDGAAPSPSVFGAPQDVVQLSADGSYDPDGTDLSYEWSVIVRPDGSGAEVGSPFVENTLLDLDIVGHFIVELTVTDEFGLNNCEPALVDITASPTEDIHVQLVWTAPDVETIYGGPDGSAGIGTDLDLHYAHPDASWGDSLTVWYGNPEGLWGAHGTVSLDIDDLWGEDPENINHADPMAGQFYRVGVHYYRDYGFGASQATVRIYFGIDLYGQYNRRLNRAGNFWYVGNVQWNPSDPVFDFLDNFMDDQPALVHATD